MATSSIKLSGTVSNFEKAFDGMEFLTIKYAKRVTPDLALDDTKNKFEVDLRHAEGNYTLSIVKNLKTVSGLLKADKKLLELWNQKADLFDGWNN